MDINQNKPFTTNQIANTKPNVPKSVSMLSGFVAGSTNGGHCRPITYKKVMAGERHREYKVTLKISTLTPLTPTYQNLRCTLRAFYVPNIRIWNNAEKYTAQKGGTSEQKISEIPNMGGKFIWQNENEQATASTNAWNTTAWRDSYVSTYIPRLGEFQTNTTLQNIPMPKMSILPLRGVKAIYNDFLRHKEYETEIQEFKGDTVSDTEWESFNPCKPENTEYHQLRAKRENSYYSDYRLELQGLEAEYPPENMNEDSALLNWSSFEHLVAEARSQSENSNKNDWDIIAEIRGTRAATQGKVQLIGKRTFNLNYAAVTQNAYNNSAEDITFKVLGKQGAYSYTEVEVPLYAGMEFIEEGYIHIFMEVSADTVYERGIDRNLLNITPLDEYRPDLIEEKNDVLYTAELGYYIDEPNVSEIVGYKRKFSEYFKLPNIVQGDMTNDNIFETEYSTTNQAGETPFTDTEVITQKTYQFFESDASKLVMPNGDIERKKIWKDYTDILLNRNQAIMNDIEVYNGNDGNEFIVKGQNQIFYVGKSYCMAELPIDDSIINNFTEWGEH